MNRRQLAQWIGFTTAAALAPSQSWAGLVLPTQPKIQRSVILRSAHTGEAGEFKYMVDGQLIRPELQRLFHLLRDHRSGDVYPIDSHVIEQVRLVQQRLGKDTAFDVISGYRSPKTNAMLGGRSSGVAKKSLHMQGKAIDIHMPGVSIDTLHKAALSLKAGGVGKYTQSGFVHLDSGRVRSWGA